MLSSYLKSHGFRLVPTDSRPLLLRRPNPDPKEGIGEYLTRLCSENRLDGPAAFARRLGLNYGQLVEFGSKGFREVLCGRAKLVSPKPGEIVETLSGKESFLRGVRTQTRVCPCCFSEEGIADKSWSWPLTLACDQHGSWLLDRCPRCSEEISLLRRRQFNCDCGYDFRAAQMQPAEHWLENFYEIFSPDRFSPLQDGGGILESDRRAFLILRSLLAPNEKSLDSKMRQVAGATLSLMRPDQLDGLREMMLNWLTWMPQRMERIAESNIKSAKRLIRRMRVLGSSELLKVATETSDAIERRRKADSLKERLGDARIRSIEELSRITGLHSQTLKVFIAKGHFKDCSITVSDTGRNSIVISKEESARIRQVYESSLNLSETAQCFDTDVLHIKTFAKANVLKPVLRHSNHSGTWRFTKDCLDLFLASLHGIARTVENNSELKELAPLGMLAITHWRGLPGRSWIRLAGRIVAGEIPIFHVENGSGLNAFAVRTLDLPEARGRG